MIRPIAALALAVFLAPVSASAQMTLDPDPAGDPAAAAFTGPWSPFELPGNLPRLLPSAPALAPGVAPAPRVGLFWTAGNPGALPLELADTRADFQLGRTTESGDYRRALDPPRGTVDRLSMGAWGPVEDRAAMIGRVRFDRVLLEPGPSPHTVRPYRSSPFTVLDTTTSDIRHTGATLEGAAGWRLGPLGLGLALGYAASDGRTDATSVPRRTQATAPAATFGLAGELLDGTLAAGLTFRWTQRTETLRINPVGAGTNVLVVDGLLEPEVIPLVQGSFYRRTQADGLGMGAGLSGRIGGWLWTAHGEMAQHEERYWSRQENDPPRDTWDADAIRGTLAVQRPFGDRLLTLHGRWETLSGTAIRSARQDAPDSTAISLTADESAFAASAELRQRVGPDSWGSALRLTAGYTDRHRNDPRSDLSVLIETLVTSASFELDRHITPRLLLSAGAAVSRHQGRGGIPHPASLGPVMEDLLYDDVALQAATAMPWSLAASATFTLRDDVCLWSTGHYDSRSATEPVFAPLPPLLGTDRPGWGLTLGATLGAPDAF